MYSIHYHRYELVSGRLVARTLGCMIPALYFSWLKSSQNYFRGSRQSLTGKPRSWWLCLRFMSPYLEIDNTLLTVQKYHHSLCNRSIVRFTWSSYLLQRDTVQFQIIVFSRFCYVLLCNHEYFHCLNHRQTKDYITRRNKTERKL